MHKYRNAAVGLGLLALVGLWFAFRASAQTKPEQASPATQADQKYQRMLDEQADRAKRAEVMLKEQEAQHKRVETLLAKQEEFFERQLRAFKRFEKVLDTWETQQQQYQKYLDTLPKK
jgi:septal ring factor EnvC (AmiA/AmiB activator)